MHSSLSTSSLHVFRCNPCNNYCNYLLNGEDNTVNWTQNVVVDDNHLIIEELLKEISELKQMVGQLEREDNCSSDDTLFR